MSLNQRSQSARLVLQYALQGVVTLRGVKSAVFYYIIVRYLLKSYHHVVGNGVKQSVLDAWKWLSLVLCVYPESYYSLMQFPSVSCFWL
jgi:hypothetical protein